MGYHIIRCITYLSITCLLQLDDTKEMVNPRRIQLRDRLMLIDLGRKLK